MFLLFKLSVLKLFSKIICRAVVFFALFCTKDGLPLLRCDGVVYIDMYLSQQQFNSSIDRSITPSHLVNYAFLALIE